MIKQMRVQVNGWNNERKVRIDENYKVSFEVAFNNGPICHGRVLALRERLDEELYRGELRHKGGQVWLDVELATGAQVRNPLKYLSRLVGAQVVEVKRKQKAK